MAYNRENLLKRIADIQDIVIEYQSHDVPLLKIWRRHIYPAYRISYSCFNRYLSVPAKAELKKLQQRKEKQGTYNPKLF
jgi:hypothetical protein